MTKTTQKVETKAKAKPIAKTIAKPVKEFPCTFPHCGKSYARKCGLSKHWHAKHETNTPPTRGRKPITAREIPLYTQALNMGQRRARNFTLYKKTYLDTVGEAWEGSPSSVAMTYQGDNYDNVLTDERKAHAGACLMTELLTRAVNQHVNNVTFNSPSNVDMRSQFDPASASSVNGGTVGRMSNGNMASGNMASGNMASGNMASGSLHDLLSRDTHEYGQPSPDGDFTFAGPLNGKKGPTFKNIVRMTNLPVVQKTVAENARLQEFVGLQRNLNDLFERMVLK